MRAMNILLRLYGLSRLLFQGGAGYLHRWLNRLGGTAMTEMSYPSDILEREDFYFDELYCPPDEVGCFN
ncbi:MAG: hypothetical protein ACYC55_09445 [Candidatus Geothermincolia bacterium]